MNNKNILRASRWLVAVLFLLDLLAVLVLSFIITLNILPLTVLGSFLLLLVSFSLAMLFRQTIVPSWLEKSGDHVIIHWNNWKLSGRLLSAGFQGKRKLLLEVSDINLMLTPVGPMMGLAGMMIKPLLGLVLPDFLAQSYYFKKESLLKKIRSGDNHYTLIFPVILLGKRKVKKWLG
ncbi:MAG: hypothetical protein KJ620_06030 [Candidatus Edwardsbacteria bacterium]|nr:hypothetical protein [Candidatus Edwardsbacteria bacterium]MBU1575843.1 hypothetical protein [Candidatus Edwardsbacteria bacterium]MBU2463629.1 hypothetical protein [Candidatus Edwardsbacteria bacterium]MBU2593057.1 hypothetical protein [Candidatus Edwardsbacteria bacterium]